MSPCFFAFSSHLSPREGGMEGGKREIIFLPLRETLTFLQREGKSLFSFQGMGASAPMPPIQREGGGWSV